MEKVICFFNSAIAWGGGEKWHFDVALRFKNAGYKVVFFAHKDSELIKRVKNEGIQNYAVEIDNLSFLNPFKLKKTALVFRKEKISILIINLSRDLKFAGLVGKKVGVKNIIYRRGSAIPIRNSFFNRYLFSNVVNNVLANSYKTKDTINEINKSLFPKSKIHVIYNGIDLKAWDNLSNDVYARSSDKIILGNIGRLVRQKGQKYLIDIAVKLKEHRISFEMRIGGDGHLVEELKSYAKEQKVYEYFDFVGFVEDSKAFLSQIDIFLLPSLWEGFGYVLVEAMACKKPIVAYNISSNPEIVADNETGFLVEFGDLDSFTNKIVLLAKDKILREKIGANGRKRVESLFTIEQTVYNLQKLLELQK